MKKRYTLLIIALLSLATWVGYRSVSIPGHVVPLPYDITLTNPGNGIEAMDSVESIDMLIIGDRMAKELYAHRELFSSIISKDLTKPLNIGVLSTQEMGAHRVVAHLKGMKKIPKIVIFHGASFEESEFKFSTKDVENIMRNVQKYEDPYIRSLLMLAPTLAKFIYTPVHRVKLTDKIARRTNSFTHPSIQKRSEVSYKLFTYELEEFVSYLEAQGVLPIIITTPYNLDIEPQETCDDSTTQDIFESTKEAKELMKKGDFKSAYTILADTKNLSPGNATVYYLLAKTNKELGMKKAAIKNLQMASAVDCRRWRTNEVYNTIMRDVANKHEVLLFDFSKMMINRWGSDLTFVDDIFPQNIYYQQAVKIFSGQIKSLLQI